MNRWIASLRATLLDGEPAVRVSVAAVKGSAPREPGACMLVRASGFEGSIGGGHLELKAIGIARDMLAQSAGTRARLDRFALGATLGQCCGGAVNLWFDRYDASDLPFLNAVADARERGPAVVATTMSPDGPARRALHTPERDPGSVHDVALAAERLLHAPPGAPRALLLPASGDRAPALLERADSPHAQLWLFGAGHVGRALVGVFADLPFDVTWVDSRPDAFPSSAPSNVAMRVEASPVEAAARAPAGAWFLVMTHSHDLDYDLCTAILRRDDHAWAGLIGSETKATCFAVRFAREGIAPQAIARLTSPIGSRTIRSKLPGAIAVSVAAQLLEQLETRAASGQSERRAARTRERTR